MRKKIWRVTLVMWIVAILMSTMMTGCVPSKTELASTGAGLMDDALDIAIWQMCFGASIGSLRREFADNQERIRAWQELCGEVGMPISPIPLDEIPGTAPALMPVPE